MDGAGKILIIMGVILIVVGIILVMGKKIAMRSLPGDIVIEKEKFSFYFPIVGSIIVSIILTILLNIFLRR